MMDYYEIPEHIRRYIPVNGIEYETYPPSVRSILYNNALREHIEDGLRYNREHAHEYVSVTIDFVWEGHYHDRHLGAHSFIEFTYHGRTDSPVIVSSENVNDFTSKIDQIVHDASPGQTWSNYQVTLVTSQGYINSSAGSLLNFREYPVVLKHG